jgi:ERCC4-type nuclease
MVKMVKLILDYRERKILKCIEKLSCEIEIGNLTVGDILILKQNNHLKYEGTYLDINGKAIIIERKTITDFVSSIRTKRIWEQLFKLMNTQHLKGYKIENRILVVQHTFEEYFGQIPFWNKNIKSDKRNFWRYMINAIIDIVFIYKIPIIFLSSDDQLNEFLNILMKREINQWNPWIFESNMYTHRRTYKKPIKDDRIYLLSSLSNIGLTLSERLLNKFTSLADISNASEKELCSVTGIGKKKAKMIFEVFHNNEKPNIKYY